MSNISTSTTLYSRVRRSQNGDVNLSKMATICGYPGASSKCLPFLHASFPASPTLPAPVKSHNVTSKREQTLSPEPKRLADENICKSVVCYRGNQTPFHLPEITHLPEERRFSANVDMGYVNKNKVCCQLKGINLKKIYSANRSKPNVSSQHQNGVECLRVTSNRNGTVMDLTLSDPWNLAVESISKATLQCTHASHKELDTYREAPHINMTMEDNIVEDRRYSISGMKGKKLKDARTLGHIVNPSRLDGILQRQEKPRPCTYYRLGTKFGS